MASPTNFDEDPPVEELYWLVEDKAADGDAAAAAAATASLQDYARSCFRHNLNLGFTLVLLIVLGVAENVLYSLNVMIRLQMKY